MLLKIKTFCQTAPQGHPHTSNFIIQTTSATAFIDKTRMQKCIELYVLAELITDKVSSVLSDKDI